MTDYRLDAAYAIIALIVLAAILLTVRARRAHLERKRISRGGRRRPR